MEGLGLDLVGFWLHVGTILALCWALWAQDLALDGLVGSRGALRIDLSFHFGANLASFWHPKSINIHPKIDAKMHSILDPSLGSIFG